MPMSRRRVALGVGANALDRVTIALITLLLVPVLASHWGLARYGGWAMLTTVPSLLVLGDLGFANAASVRMTMEIARGEVQQARRTVRSASQVIAITCGLILALVGGLAWLLPDRFILGIPQTSIWEMRQVITALGVYACLVLGCALLQGVFRSNSRFALGTVLSTTTFVLENGLLLLVVWRGYGIAAGALALMLGRLAGSLIMVTAAALLRTEVMPGLTGGSAMVRRELLSPALAAMSITLANALLLQGTVAALGLVAGAALVPAFVAARTLSRIGLQGSQILTTALMPEFGAETAKGNHGSVVQMFVAVLGTAAAIAVPFAIVLALAGPGIVSLWSNNHIHAPAALMLAIAVSALCGGIWNPLSNLMLAINRQSEFAIAYAILAALGVVLTWLLGPQLGSVAPGLALATVDFMMLVVVGRFAMRHWGKTGDLATASRELADKARSDLRRIMRRTPL
jgi:O-antigen/teichoic acid export membrane protein